MRGYPSEINTGRSMRQSVFRPAVLLITTFVVVGLVSGCGAAAPPVQVMTQAVPAATSRAHVAEGTPVSYATNPPTSGEHWGTPAQWGFYNESAPPDERLVHNLEHGGIVMYYNPAALDATALDKFKALARALNNERNCTILAPRTSIDNNQPIVLTAWGIMATLSGYDEAAIRAFWQDHVAQGPEFDPGVCG